MKVQFRGKVKQGRFIPADPRRFSLAFVHYKDGTPIEVIIRKPRKERSTDQNKYYWGVVIDIISDMTGFSPQEAHDCMRMKFLTSMVEVENASLPRAKSTTELTTVEFMDYVAQIQQFAAEFLGVYIPDPNEEMMEA